MTPVHTAGRWALPARILHWVMAAAIPLQFALGWIAEHDADRDTRTSLIQVHYQFGMLLFLLILLRIAWRVARGSPPALADEPRWRATAASIVHGLLYMLFILLPVSGYVIWVWMGAPMTILGFIEIPRLFTPPAEDETGRALAWYIHTYGAWAIAGLIALHVSAALYHECILKDGLVRTRML